MVSKILTASALALSLSMGAFSFAAIAQTGGGSGTGGTGTGNSGSGGSVGAQEGTGGGATAGTGGAVSGQEGTNGSNANGAATGSQKNKIYRPFYSDDAMKTTRSQDEITSAFNGMSAEDQAAARGQCDGADAMSYCAMLPAKK